MNVPLLNGLDFRALFSLQAKLLMKRMNEIFNAVIFALAI